MAKQKRVGLVHILNLIKEGKSPAQISKDLSVAKQTIAYYVDKLKKLDCIERVGYGSWRFIKDLKQVPINHKGTRKGSNSDLQKREIRGHAFIWKIRFYDPINWENVVQKYKKLTLTFQRICKGKVFRTIFRSRKIWLTKDGMVIYESLDFFGPSSFSVKGTAVYEMDLIVKDLLRKLGLRFREYQFTTSREHYAIIKNELAKQYNDRKEKMIIKTEDGSVWLWIDHSKGEHELETKDPIINRQVQNHYNSHRKHGFKHDADFIENQDQKIKKHDQIIDKSMKVLKGYSEQIALHLEVEKQQLKTQKETQRILTLMEKKLK